MAKFIQSDYDTALECASNLRWQAKIVEACRTRENDRLRSSKTYWQGNCGDEMREGMNESRARMEKIANELESLADDITTVAKQLKDKDEQLSKTIANTLETIKDWFD